MQSGTFLVGESMDALEVNVQWSIHDDEGNASGVPSTLTGVSLRGGGFTPGGVSGRLLADDGSHAPTVDDAALAWAVDECGIDPESQSYRVGTFYFQFTKLHKPGRRPNGKRNAALNVNVDAGEAGTARLGTNLHVATGPDNG